MASEIVLRTENLTKYYGKRAVVNNVNMTINRGDIYGFVGKNGAGKTTFMKLVLRLAFPTSGEIELFGQKDFKFTGSRVGSLIETPSLYKECSGYETLRRYSILYGADVKKIDDILRMVDLYDARNYAAGKYSLGMKQRLGIAIALLGDPLFMVLDEPVNGLDPVGIKAVGDLIQKLNKEQGITFLISSHLLDNLARTATKIGMINNGILLEELTLAELESRSGNSITYMVDDVAKARAAAASIVSEGSISLFENRIVIKTDFDKAAILNKKMVEDGVMVSGIFKNAKSLEDEYLERVGAK